MIELFGPTMLQGDINTEKAEYFYENYVASVTGWLNWKSNKRDKNISSFCDPSDEALALVLLQNYGHTWIAQFAGKKDIPAPRFTKSARKDATKHGGWKLEGLDLFNKLRKAIRKRRKKPNWKAFETAYQNKCHQQMMNMKQMKKKKATKQTDLLEDAVMRDFFNDDDSGDEDAAYDRERVGSEPRAVLGGFNVIQRMDV